MVSFKFSDNGLQLPWHSVHCLDKNIAKFMSGCLNKSTITRQLQKYCTYEYFIKTMCNKVTANLKFKK
jgi:hypothetical protein